jgi:hypothetical protein
MMVKLPHTEPRTRHQSAKGGAAGHKPDDLVPCIGLQRQHDYRFVRFCWDIFGAFHLLKNAV